MQTLPPFLQLIPEYRAYVWGGSRLRPGQQTAEAWIVHESDRILGGPCAGRSLGELAAEFGPDLLGRAGFARGGGRFPLLVKLLDCAGWLSVQVHPDDEQAARLEGPGQSGKTEAWHVLEADPGAWLIAGLKPGISPAALAEAIRSGTVVEICQQLPVGGGDTAFIRAGTIHALGPGLLIYEVQQSSDLTYRVFDWNRPLSAGRTLHIDKSLAVADPAAVPQVGTLPAQADGGAALLVECPYFRLERILLEQKTYEAQPGAESFQALTVIEGAARLSAGGEQLDLARFETVLLPAQTGAFRLEPLGGVCILQASVPA